MEQLFENADLLPKGDIIIHLVETERWPDGGYRPCFTEAGKCGYWKAKDWNWGRNRELAQQWCDERNETAGYSPKEAMLVVLESMGYGEGCEE